MLQYSPGSEGGDLLMVNLIYWTLQVRGAVKHEHGAASHAGILVTLGRRPIGASELTAVRPRRSHHLPSTRCRAHLVRWSGTRLCVRGF